MFLYGCYISLLLDVTEKGAIHMISVLCLCAGLKGKDTDAHINILSMSLLHYTLMPKSSQLHYCYYIE